MKSTILLSSLLFSLLCSAQLKGVVKDNNNPLAFVNIVLLDSTGKFTAGTTTKEDGTFNVLLKEGTYKLKISFIGYADFEKQITIEQSLDLGVLLLSETATSLNEVVVDNRKKRVEQKIDRLVYTIENSVVAHGGDALTALKTAPGVIVQNNSISILGKGASRILIDGRMVELSGDELANFLKTIASNDIKNIEVITNPSAKYDANGDGGLININLKKGAKDSWKNATSVVYDQNTYSFSTMRNTFFYSKNKLRFSVSGNVKSGASQEKESLDIYYPNGLWNFRNETKIKEDNFSGSASLDYNVSEASSIGFQYLGSRGTPDRDSKTSINIDNASNQLQSILINKGFNDLRSEDNSFNAHFTTKLDSIGRKLSVDADYFTYHSKFDNRFVTKTYLPDMTFVDTNQSAQNTSNQHINNFSLKADVEHPLKSLELSYGAKLSFINSRSNINYFNTISGTPVLDPQQSNQFEYKEKNQSVYVNGSKKITDKLQIQLGLRLESTQTKGFSETLNQETDTDYIKLFPDGYINYQENEKNSFNLSYGKRINRPSFSLLNPFRSYINSNSYSEGNPFLKPSFSDNFDFTYSYTEKFRTNLFLNYTSQGYGVIFTSNPVTNTQIVTRENYFNEYYYGIGENYSATIVKWWETQSSLYLLGAKTNFTKALDAEPANNTQLYFSTTNSFTLTKTAKLEVEYSYSSAVRKGLYDIGYMSGLTIGFQQSYCKKSLQLSILLNDIFNTNYLKNYNSRVNGINQVYSENNSSRFIRLALTYSLGNKKINELQHESGNEEEKKRTLKNK